MPMHPTFASPAVLKMNAELAAADPALVRNDDLLAAVFSGSSDCVKILDLDGHLQFMSEGGKRVMDVEDFGPLKGCPWPDFWTGEGNAAAKAAVVSAREGTAAHFSGVAATLAGRPRYWDVQVLPIAGADGRPTHLLSISRDVTEAKLAEKTAQQLDLDLRDVAMREAEGMRRLFEVAPSFMCTLEGPHHVFKIVNDAFQSLAGPRALVGRPFRQALSELEGQGIFDLLDTVYASGEAHVARGAAIQLRRGDGDPMDTVFLNVVLQPIRDAKGAVTGVFVEGDEVTDLKQAEIALREREVQLQLALDSAEMGVWEAILSDGRIVSTLEDERASALLGRRPGQPPSYETFVTRVHPDDQPELSRAIDEVLDESGGGHLDVEYRVLPIDERPERWIHARAKVVREKVQTRLVGTIRDITTRKDAENQYALLNGELQHRIKNTLAMVSAIASQTLKGEAIVEQRDTFNARLHTLAHAHDLLMGQAQEKGHIRDVIETALAPHRGNVPQFTIDGPDLLLSSKQTLSLALAVHELATNAAKYGALSDLSGRVHILWGEETVGAEAPAFVLRWVEKGGPPVSPPTRSGFGSRLITRVLASDFNGQVTMDYAPAGLVCSLVSREQLGDL